MLPDEPIQITLPPPWDGPVDAERLRRAARAALSAEQAAPDAALSLVVVDDEEMAALHGHYRADPTTTDVLTFPFDPSGEPEEEMAGYLGDVVICYDQAARQAADEGHGVQEELELLVVHGVLHLLGYEDEAGDEARRAMWARQAAILGTLGLAAIAPRDDG